MDATPKAWVLWEDKKRASKLNRALDVLEAEAQRFVAEQGRTVAISLTRTRWDEPELELRWAPGAIHRSVLVRLQFPSESGEPGNRFPAHRLYEEYDYKHGWKLKVTGAAWQDEDVGNSPGKRIRRWTSIYLGTHPFKGTQEEEKQDIQAVLVKAFSAVSALSVSDLTQSEVIRAHG